MKQNPGFSRWHLMVAPLCCLLVVRAYAAPAWYTPDNGGFDPNIPDFYQHQNWRNNDNANPWEAKNGGWCYYVAWADAFYSLTKAGYADLLNADITKPDKWFDTAYKPGDVANADLLKLEAAMKLKTVQQYLDAKGHKSNDPNSPLVGNDFKVDKDGLITYKTPAPKKGDPDITTKAAVFDFYDLKTRAGDAMTVEIDLGDAKFRTSPEVQGIWWAFHQVAAAGLDTKTKTIFVADPDTNRGSRTAFAGWPLIDSFPGDPPAGMNSLGLKSSPTDPIPIPDAPKIGDLASYNRYYAGLILNNANKVTGDTDNVRFNKSTVRLIETVHAPTAMKMAAAGAPGAFETALAVNSSGDYVDRVYIAPSSQTLDSMNTDFADLFSFTAGSSMWSAHTEAFDPFGNERVYGGVEYDLLSGSPLGPGDVALANLGTMSDFTSSGFEILLHFAGDPSTLWTPQVIGSDVNSVVVARDQEMIPEPAAALLIALGAGLLALPRRSCTRDHVRTCAGY